MNRRTKLALDRDKKIKALHGGKRISAEGNVYYENRPNRTDLNRTKKFGKGGDLWTPLDFTSIEEYFDYINDSLINGNRNQVKELYNDMDESQKKHFFRYAAMQEGSFDEVVDYINEHVREYKKGGSIGYNRIIDPVTKKIKIVGSKSEKIENPKVSSKNIFNSNHNNDREILRFSRKFAKGGAVTIDGKKAMYKVKYSLDGGKQKVGYVVRDTEEDGQRVSQWLLYNNKKELVKSMSPQEAHEMVKNDKLVLAKKYDVDTEPKKEIDPDVEVKDMPYAERIEWIKNNLVPKIKSAKKVWYSFDSGNTYDLNDEKSTEKFIEDARAAADYSNTENFESSTLFITENGHSLESPDGEEFDKIVHDNTYNTSYLGVLDWDFNVFNIYDSRFVLAARPHLGGDVRGNYGDAIYFEDESKDAVLMKFYEKIVDGQRQVSIEFKGGSEVRFDATQNSDVSYYELYEDGSKLKLGSPAELLVSTFSTYGSWKGDDFVEEIVDEFERSKENKAKKMADGGGVENVQESLYVTEFYDGDGNLMGYTVKDKYNPSGKYTLSSKRERAEENRQYLIDNPSRLAYYRKNEYANGGSVGDKFQVGDLVFNRTLGSRGLVGLVVSESKYDKEYEMTEYDVLYRGYSGDIIPTEESDLVDITEGYIDFAESNGDLMHYPNIAKKQGITLNPKYQEAIDEYRSEEDYDGDEEYSNGGELSDKAKYVKTVAYLNGISAKDLSFEEWIKLARKAIKARGEEVPQRSAFREVYNDVNKFKRGGTIKQRGAQYERDVPYGSRDTSVRARPVGYRYRKVVDKSSGRLRKIEKTDKEYYQPVTQKDIKAYEEMDKNARKRIYKEVRSDHSDKNPKNKRAY